MPPEIIPIPTKRLPDGNTIPFLGYGTGSEWFKEDSSPEFDHHLVDALKRAIKSNFVHIDTAEKYGTEAEVGAALKQSGITRDQVFVTTKVLASIRDIPKAIDSSLSKLGLDWVDLFLIHEPFWAQSNAEIQDAWAAMEQIKENGKAKSIGVSNFGRQHLEAVMQTAKIRPTINQIEYHPYLLDTDFVALHKKYDIAIAAYAPLTPLVRAAPGPVDGMLESLARKYNVSPAAVLLRWCFDQDLIAISTSREDSELHDYLQSFTFKLTISEVESISREGRKKHFRSFYAEMFENIDS